MPLALQTYCDSQAALTLSLGAWRKDGIQIQVLRPWELDWQRPLPHWPKGSALIPYSASFSLWPLRSPLGSCSYSRVLRHQGRLLKLDTAHFLNLTQRRNRPALPWFCPSTSQTLHVCSSGQIASWGGEQALLVEWEIGAEVERREFDVMDQKALK